jgi:4-hydroxyproline epimerase
MRSTFFCIDGHTAGNPVRLVAGGAPLLHGASMAERRLDFMERFDWIRTGLCFEPRGHDMMSGGFLYPPTRADADVGILFIETSGCLPMCGHGTIGILTFGLEHGLIRPRIPGELRVEVPAGLLQVAYVSEGNRIASVRIRNVASYLVASDVQVEVPNFGSLRVDVAYGGNYYAIVEPQGPYAGLDSLGASRLIELSVQVRERVQDRIQPVHPLEPSIRGVSHVLWADRPKTPGADARNAVFYGARAIDRSPCGTGTSARMAQLTARGKLRQGDRFVHESYIGSRFIGRVEEQVQLAGHPAIVPSIEGSARATGMNTLWIDDADPFWRGFQVI